MRTDILLLLALVSSTSWAQSERPALLVTDPFQSNGYFIMNSAEWTVLSVDHVVVEVKKTTVEHTTGETTTNTLETFTISDPTFGNISRSHLEGVGENEVLGYTLSIHTTNNDVIEYQGLCNGCTALPVSCYLQCEAATYAWRLRVMSNQVQSYIDMVNGTNQGQHFYFYVKNTDWIQFQSQYPPSAFGLAHNFMDYVNAPQTYGNDVIKLNSAPPSALDENGFQLGWYTGIVYGIRKDKGPWRDVYAVTYNQGSPALLCSGGSQILTAYNNDGQVQTTFSIYGVGPVTCQALISNGPGGAVPCTSIGLWDPGIDGDLMVWVQAVVDCYSSDESPWALEDIFLITVDEMSNNGVVNQMTLEMPNVENPKLIPIERTELQPGLHEFMIVRKDGSVFRHYEAIEQTQVISASFAAFVDLNIYPVPVASNTFAIDVDILAPMVINVNVINNQGTPYYTTVLDLEVVGRNKHVVDMGQQWPNGIYHAVFSYPDGSSEALTFTVERS